MKQSTHKTEPFSPHRERVALDIPHERRAIFDHNGIREFDPKNSKDQLLFTEFEEGMNNKASNKTKEDLTNFNRNRLNSDPNLYVALGRPSRAYKEYASMSSLQLDQDGNQPFDDSKRPLADPEKFMLKVHVPNEETRKHVSKNQNNTPRSAVNHEMWHRDAVGYILQNPLSKAEDTLADVERDILFNPKNYLVGDLIYKNLPSKYENLLSRPGGQNELSANWIAKIGAAEGESETLRALLENRDKRFESNDEVASMYSDVVNELIRRGLSQEKAKKTLSNNLPYKKQRAFFQAVKEKGRFNEYPKSFNDHIENLKDTSKQQEKLVKHYISALNQHSLAEIEPMKNPGKDFNDFVTALAEITTNSYGEDTRRLEEEVQKERLARQPRYEEEKKSSDSNPPQFFSKRNKSHLQTKAPNLTGNSKYNVFPKVPNVKIEKVIAQEKMRVNNDLALNKGVTAVKKNQPKLNYSYGTTAVIPNKAQLPLLSNKTAAHRKLLPKKAQGGSVTMDDLYDALAHTISPYPYNPQLFFSNTSAPRREPNARDIFVANYLRQRGF